MSVEQMIEELARQARAEKAPPVAVLSRVMAEVHSTRMAAPGWNPWFWPGLAAMATAVVICALTFSGWSLLGDPLWLVLVDLFGAIG